MEDILQMKDKNIVVMGVANKRSLAWGVARSLYKAGANIIFTYRKERSYTKLQKLLEEEGMQAEAVVQCDVNNDESIQEAFAKIGEQTGVIHGVCHSIAFAHAEDLKGDFIETSRDGLRFRSGYERVFSSSSSQSEPAVYDRRRFHDRNELPWCRTCGERVQRHGCGESFA